MKTAAAIGYGDGARALARSKKLRLGNVPFRQLHKEIADAHALFFRRRGMHVADGFQFHGTKTEEAR